MSMRRVVMVCLVLGLVCTGVSSAGDSRHRIGAGVHYWFSVDDIEFDNVKEEGFAWVFSYQYRPLWLVKLEADVEILPEHYGGYTDPVYAPQAYVIVGSWVYGGAGIGMLYSDGDFADDPFYRLRAGFDIPVLPRIRLDVHANYQFTEWEHVKALGESLDTDVITLAAAVRLEL